MIFRILTRDFQNPLYLPNLDFQVKRYSKHVIGGPESADVKVSGVSWALYELFEWLGCPVEILDDHMRVVWVGYLGEIKLNVGTLLVGVRLDEMYNRVAVTYSDTAGGGQGGGRATTAWAEDADSISQYGRKELMVSIGEGNSSLAESVRDRFLDEHKYPIPVIEMSQAKSAPGADLVCRGWFSTLEWRYYSQAAGRESYDDVGSDEQPFGNHWSVEAIGQSFKNHSSTTWSAGQVMVKIAEVGSPDDGIYCRLFSDSSGAPGTLLGTSGVVTDAVTSTSMDWVTFTFSPAVALSPGGTYWFVIAKAGGVMDGANYFKTTGNEKLGYADGAFRIYNGSWYARSPDMDLNFAVIGYQLNSAQIEAVVAASGANLTGSWTQYTDVIESSQYRAGDNTAKYEIEELLKSGTGSGVGVCAMVNQNRELVLSADPTKDAYLAELYIDQDGNALDRWGNPISGQECPVGVWAVLQDVLPANLDLGRLADPTMVFVERAEYDAEKERYRPQARKARSAFEFASLLVDV